jgi:hypothetical protein
MPMNFQMSREDQNLPEIPEDGSDYPNQDTVDGEEIYKGEKSKNSQVPTSMMNLRLVFLTL